MKPALSLLIAVFLASVLLFPSCGITLYVPNTVNSPLLGEKGDYRVNAGLVLQAPQPTADFQGAYAVTNNFGIMANTSLMSGSDGGESGANTHYLLEGAGGFFTPFGLDDSDFKMGRLEFYAGYGRGWAQDYDEDDYLYKGQYGRVFLQPAVGFRQKVADFSFATRIAMIDFNEYESPTPTTTAPLKFSTIEPTATVSLGYKKGRVYLQLSRVLLLSGEDDYQLITRFDEGDEFKLNIGGTFSTWREKYEKPPTISLGDQENKVDSDNKKENEEPEQLGRASEAPASILVEDSDFAICVKEGGDPDGDIISLSFNGVYLAKELELARAFECFDVALVPGQEGILRIETIDTGVFTPNTVQLLIRQGKEQRLYYLRMEADGVETIRFSQQ